MQEHAASRDVGWARLRTRWSRRPDPTTVQRRRRARDLGCAFGLGTGAGGGASAASSFGLSLDRYDSPSITKS